MKRFNKEYAGATLVVVFLHLIFCLKVVYAQDVVEGNKQSSGNEITNIVGKVTDSVGLAIQGVNIKLISSADNLLAVTGVGGKFVFEGVKSGKFKLMVNILGYQSLVKTYHYTGKNQNIVLESIKLNQLARQLEEVLIKSEPTIVNKADTVEYFARDYVTEKRDRVADLVEKMQGVEVDSDGNVKYMGEIVLAAKLNGTLYEGGDLAKAIRSLPAEIVSKIQFIDDYGEKAELTGIKSGKPVKVLNVVTRTDKSVGNSLKFGGAASNYESYNSDVKASRMNKNLNYSATFKLANELQGIPNDISSATMPFTAGNNRRNDASFNYSNKFKQNSLNFGYNYLSNHSANITDVYSEQFTTYGSIFSTVEGNLKEKRNQNDVYLSSILKIADNGSLRFRSGLKFADADRSNRQTILKTGTIINQNELNSKNGESNHDNVSASIGYSHALNKSKTSLFAEANYNNNKIENPENQEASFYSNHNQTLDSLLRRSFDRNDARKQYNASLGLTERISQNNTLSGSVKVSHNANNVRGITSQLNDLGIEERLYHLDNIYTVELTKTEFSVNHLLDNKLKGLRLSSSFSVIPTALNRQRLGEQMHRSQINTFVEFSAMKSFSKESNLMFSFNRASDELDFLKLYAVPDVSNPQNYIIGNPKLKSSNRSNLSLALRQNKIDRAYNFSVKGGYMEDAVINNNIQVFENGTFLRNETRYLNVDGNYNVSANYHIYSKINKVFNITTEGSGDYQKNAAMNNDILGSNLQTNVRNQITLGFNAAKRKIVSKIILQHQYLKNLNTINQLRMMTNRINTNLDMSYRTSKMIGFKLLMNKNFVSGMSFNRTKNPLVINAMADMYLFKGLVEVSLTAYDLLKQNDMIFLNFSDLGKTETKSNLSSRFVVLKTRFHLQKWTAAKSKGNKPILRKGDGSFLDD